MSDKLIKASQLQYVKEYIDNEVDTKQDTLTFDEIPTENSDNPVTSDGIYDDIHTNIVDDTNEEDIKTINTSALPLTKCVVGIEPQQDLNGYTKPWVGGANVNKFPNALSGTQTLNGITVVSDGKGTYTISGTAEANTTIAFDLISDVTFPISVGQGGNGVFYIFNDFVETNASIVFFSDTALVSYFAFGTENRVVNSYQTLGGQTISRVGFYIISGNTVSGSFSPMLVTNSSTTETYSPYENICPVTGWDAVNLYKRGKNLKSISDFTVTTSTYDAQIIAISKYYAGTYTLSWTQEATLTSNVRNTPYYMKNDGTRIYYSGSTNTNLEAGRKSWTFTLDEDTIASFRFWGSGFDVDCIMSDFQLEIGSTATAYEAYNNATYTTALSTTCYSGSVDITNGARIDTYAIVDLSTLVYSYRTDTGYPFFTGNLKTPASSHTTTVAPNIISDRYQTLVWQNVTHAENDASISSTNAGGSIYIQDSRYTSVSDLKAALSGVYIYYEIATPITSTETSTQITPFDGVSNIWADSGKIKQVTYYTGNNAANKLLSQVNDLLEDKADSDDVYTKDETDNLLANKANSNDVYTKTETDNLLTGKANTSHRHSILYSDNGDAFVEVTNDYEFSISGNNNFGNISALNLTDDRKYDLPDANGTIALEETLPITIEKAGVFENDIQPDESGVITTIPSTSGIFLLTIKETTNNSQYCGLLICSGGEVALTKLSGIRYFVSEVSVSAVHVSDRDSYDIELSSSVSIAASTGYYTLFKIQ